MVNPKDNRRLGYIDGFVGNKKQYCFGNYKYAYNLSDDFRYIADLVVSGKSVKMTILFCLFISGYEDLLHKVYNDLQAKELISSVKRNIKILFENSGD